MRKTKIVCTLGPATDKNNSLEKLMKAGMNVARLNFSHGNHEEHGIRVQEIKKLREKLNIPIAIILDTMGPDVRLGNFENGKTTLNNGDTFVLTSEDITGNNKICSISHKNLSSDIKKKDIILIDDGLIELKVIDTTNKEVKCEVINGGPVSNRKGLNFPGIHLSLPFVSEKDIKDIKFAIENDFDFIAASFVRNSNDVRELKQILYNNNCENIKIISKIENKDGVENIDEILRVSDGVMIARGDMGVEIPFEELPAIQKDIIKKSNKAGKPVITATQMLESMITNPRPTRAEITDVANAVFDGTSAIMLSGETSIGEFPIDAVLTMTKIALKAENNIDYISKFKKTYFKASKNVTNAISHATCNSAHLLGASSIITVTQSGHTARMVSKYRPSCQIIAATPSHKIYNQLSLSWAVCPIVVSQRNTTTDDIFNQAIDKAFEEKFIKNGDLTIITGGMPIGISGTTNIMKIHIVGDILVEGKGINNLSATGNLFVLHEDDMPGSFNAGDILVIKETTDEILPLFKNASAIVTEESDKNSKASIAGKTLEIPVLTDVKCATDILKSGIIVTVDAKKGQVLSVKNK